MANNFREDVPTSNDFGLTANWGSALATGQTLVLPYDSGAITTNLDFSANDFDGISFGNDKRIPVGGSGSPLKAEVNRTSTGILRDLSYGDKYLSPGGSGKIWWRAEFSPSRPTVYGLSTGIAKTLYFGPMAQATILDTFSIDNSTGKMVCAGGTTDLLDKTGDVPARLIYTAGEHTVRRDFGELIVGGTAVVHLDLTAGLTGGTISLYGGRLNHLAGDAGVVGLYGGVYDKSKLRKPATIDSLITTEAGTEVTEPGDIVVTMTSGRIALGRGAKKVAG